MFNKSEVLAMLKSNYFRFSFFGGIIIFWVFLNNLFAFDKPKGPFEVKLNIESTVGSENATLVVKCRGLMAFINGEVSIKYSQDTIPIIDYDRDERLKKGRITIWRGNSDAVFVKELRYPFNLKIGEKAFFNVMFSGTTIYDQHFTGHRQSIFMHNTNQGITTSISSFDDLYEIEVFSEIKMKGYEKLSRRDIMKLDPDLADRIKKMHTKWPEQIKRERNKGRKQKP
ncbi:MAG: hypothetical protein C0417_08630 [Chlorobiaceae bacterium]|nr:hypothetical protein [Chlorobiaceae bacterium]